MKFEEILRNSIAWGVVILSGGRGVVGVFVKNGCSDVRWRRRRRRLIKIFKPSFWAVQLFWSAWLLSLIECYKFWEDGSLGVEKGMDGVPKPPMAGGERMRSFTGFERGVPVASYFCFRCSILNSWCLDGSDGRCWIGGRSATCSWQWWWPKVVRTTVHMHGARNYIR